MDISTTFLDTKVSAPFGFAPAAMHRLAHRDGELATSRAAAKMGIPMGLSAYATESCEDVISQGGDNPYIIQINFLEKREIMSELLSRAETRVSGHVEAGYKAVFLTVDVPVFGIRMNEYRNSFGLPKGLTWPNLLPGQDMSDLNRSDDPLAYECGAEWEEAAAFVRSNTKLPVWLKGIYTADDVALAIKHGFDGVVISNHGGRQLDGVPATLDALRECAPVAMGKIPIAIDGGIRRGTDIFKALALGADFCFLGRIPIWGLAYNGQEGVELAVHILIKELKVAMGISGSTSPQTIHVSGQVGSLGSGTVPTDYESQIHLALLNLRRILVASGTTVEDISKLTLYIVNYDAKNRLHTRHIQKFLGSHRPAITLVPVQQLAAPEWLFEIDAVISTNIGAPAKPFLAAPTQTPKTVYDVLVVGAGLSGLAAARDVIKAGLSCVVLEARDRVGGKTWSQKVTDGKGVVDLGAAWINDTNQSRMIALAKQIDAELIEQNTIGNAMFQDFDGKVHSFPYGDLPKFDGATRENIAYIRDLVEAECQKLDSFAPQNIDYDSLTFEAFLVKSGANKYARETAATWTRAMLGQEPRDISALYFMNYCKAGGGLLQMRSDRKHGGQFLRVRLGTQTFSEGLAAALPKGTIITSTPVQSVTQHPHQPVAITSSSGRTFLAKKVILSVPGPCLKSITFTPSLPESTTVLFSSLTYGYYTKAMLVFKTPFWTTHGYCGLSQSFKGPAGVIRDTSIPSDNKYALTCFLGGDPGRAWSHLSDPERLDSLLQQVAQLFTPNNDLDSVKQNFIEIMAYEWTKDEFAGWGCPCTALPPGILTTSGDALGKPVGDLHFIGTETAGVWKGYMEGALRTGERGAAEVVAEIGKRVQSKL
ncbi:putative flavin-containing amine [Phaeomoniella chlamydospora]|uniref:Amine oxidase n=1 Tax=Phaeomoniella chlamydospora TaxID=158046 RepID=A0A0G2EC06_PHACM|nr:putative flavin-containing amine [Phaeomoniella chlamydospora]